jgi:sugar phosphate permease
VSSRRKPHYAWIVAAVTFLVLLVGAGTRSAPSVLIVPLEQEFGWSRATISFAVAVNIFLYGMTGPFAAAFMDRFGIRRTVIGALALVATGVAATIPMRESWQLVVLWGFIVGSGTGFVALVMASMIATRWFVAQRGLVMGLLTASTATGQLVFLPLFAKLAEAHGWRTVAATLACVALAAIVPVALLLRDRPEEAGLAPYGADATHVASVRSTANPIGTAFRVLVHGLKSRDFLLLAGTFFICGASTNGLIGTHLISACLDHGIAEVAAASLLAVMGIFDFFGTTASGWLSDRFDPRKLLFFYYGFRGVSLIFLPYSFISLYGLSLFAVFYGLDWIATVPPTVRLTTQSFGEENVGVYYGWIGATHQLGAASAAWLAGIVRVEAGDYFYAFVFAGCLCLIAAVSVLFIGRGKPAEPLGAPAVA